MRTQISLPQPVPETVRSQRSPFVMGVKHFASLNLLITQRPEGSAQLLTEDLRPFPGGEVAALISLVPVDEVAEGTSPQRYSRSVETTTRLLHVTAPLSCWHVLAVRLQIQNLVGGPGFEPGASRSRTLRHRVQKCRKRLVSVRKF